MSGGVDLILGPVQIGYSAATFLYGLMSVQTYIYLQDYSDDPRFMRALVVAVWLSELGHQLSCSHLVFYYTIRQFNNALFMLAPAPKSFQFFILFHGLTTLIVSWFFIIRLWSAAKEILLAAFLATVMLVRSILVFIVAGFAFTDGTLVDFFLRHETILKASLFVVTFGEIFLTLSLSYDLYLRRQTPIYRMWSRLDRVIMWTIATGSLTSILAVVMVICFMTMPLNLVWLGIFFPLSRFFAIALLASLNARGSSRRVDLSAAQISMEARTSPTSHRLSDKDPVRVVIVKETLKNGTQNSGLDSKENGLDV